VVDVTEIELAASAILAKVPSGYGMTKAEATTYVRAVLETIRNPTEEMLQAARPCCDEIAALDSWHVMIDFILNAPT